MLGSRFVAPSLLLLVTSAGCSGGPGNFGEGFPEGGVFGTDPGDAGGQPATDDPPSSCIGARPPASAVSSVSIRFAAIEGIGTANAKDVGYDRDGRCTASTSTDVCTRSDDAPASVQVDSADGVDNNFATIIQLFERFNTQVEAAGSLTTDGTGRGTLEISSAYNAIHVPVELALVDRNGTTATVSAIVETEALTAETQRVAGSLDKSLCGGASIEDMKTRIRQSSDILPDGTNRPGVTCSAISLGLKLTGVSDATVPPFTPGADPCGK